MSESAVLQRVAACCSVVQRVAEQGVCHQYVCRELIKILFSGIHVCCTLFRVHVTNLCVRKCPEPIRLMHLYVCCRVFLVRVINVCIGKCSEPIKLIHMCAARCF